MKKIIKMPPFNPPGIKFSDLPERRPVDLAAWLDAWAEG